MDPDEYLDFYEKPLNIIIESGKFLNHWIKLKDFF